MVITAYTVKHNDRVKRTFFLLYYYCAFVQTSLQCISQNVNLFDIQCSKCYRKTCSCKINPPSPFIFHKPPADIRLLEPHILEQTQSLENCQETLRPLFSEHYFLFSTEQKSFPQAGCRSTRAIMIRFQQFTACN